MIESKSGIGGREVEKELDITPDYINAWMMVLNAAREYLSLSDEKEKAEFLDLIFSLIKPVETYEGYFLRKGEKDDSAIFRESNVTKVRKIDQLVSEFNSVFSEMVASKDIGRLIEFAKKINRLVRGTEIF